MERAVFLERFQDVLYMMSQIIKAKSHDYSLDEDVYENFKKCHDFKLCSTEAGILVRILDKVSRVTNLLSNKGRVEDEKISDTLVDLANYAIILLIYLYERKDNRVTE